MCGFSGFLAPPQEIDRTLLAAMGRQLSRRGPDDEQIYRDDHLALVFRRLSIVDVQGGTQPIWNEDRTLFAVVNGEIYNHADLRTRLRHSHRFRSASDSEIALHLFEERGAESLELLEGMYAIAIWDTIRRRLFLARDRLGIKPLYYVSRPDLFLFGSELKALLVHPQCPRELRWSECLPSYFDVPLFPHVPTFVDGVDQLLGGECALVSADSFRKTRYWSLDAPSTVAAHEPAGPQAYVADYQALLEDSVRKHLMSDVPVGAFLSGGLDSSLVVAAAARHCSEIHCFSVLEESTFRSGDAVAARQLTDALGVPFHQVYFDSARLPDQLDFGLSTLEYFVWLMDSPRFALEWLLKHELHRYAKTVVPALKVILLGQGADEFAGGYSNEYREQLGGGRGWSHYVEALGALAREHFFEQHRVPEAFRPLLAHRYLQEGRPDGFSGEARRRLVTLQAYNLWHEDRTAAGNGVEARVPFLDHRLVELLASVPESCHGELFWDKAILRHVASRWLPEALRRRPKVAFYRSRDLTSIERLSRRLLSRSVPEFLEQYGGDDAIFDRESLQQTFESTELPGQAGRTAVHVLFGCMSIAIFERLCRDLGRNGVPARLTEMLLPPSPLTEVDATFLESWAGLQDETELTLRADSSFALAPGVSVMAPFDDLDGIAFARDGTIEQELTLPEKSAWVRPILEALARAETPLSAEYLAALVGMPIDELQWLLQFLADAEWITVRLSAD